MTDAEKLAAIRALAAEFKWVASDRLMNIIDDAEQYRQKHPLGGVSGQPSGDGGGARA